MSPELLVESAWQVRALCQHDPDAWFKRATLGWAAHQCRRHCPVLEQCSARLKSDLAQGIRPIDGVVAGRRFNAESREMGVNTKAVKCDACVVDEALVRRDIAAYSRRKGELRCGTAAGFEAHLEASEPPCRSCRTAWIRRHRRAA